MIRNMAAYIFSGQNIKEVDEKGEMKKYIF